MEDLICKAKELYQPQAPRSHCQGELGPCTAALPNSLGQLGAPRPQCEPMLASIVPEMLLVSEKLFTVVMCDAFLKEQMVPPIRML